MPAQKLSWRNEVRRVSDLVPNPKNPRSISPKQMEDLKRSLKKFGLVELPAINTNNRILAGHQRLLALQLLGRGDEKIPVRVPTRPLTKKEYDQYLLTSNRVHGEWDYQMLAEQFDVEMLLASGFDDGDLSVIFDDLQVEDDEFDPEKELKKIKKTDVKPGSLYQLGPHRILCGDSTNSEVVKKLMGGKSAAVILQDPPYNIGLSYNKGIGGKGNYGGETNDAKSDEEYESFLRKALANGVDACEKDAHVFTYHDPRYTWLLQKLYKELGIAYKRTCLWVKNNSTPTPNVAFNRQYEPALYGVIGKPYLSERSFNFSEILNRDVGIGNRTIDDIYDLIDIWLVKRLGGSEYEHPTEKPPMLHERPLRRCTKPGDIVLDLFSGSSSIMVACHGLKRIAYMVEREPIFVQLSLNRYAKLTGEKAKRIA
ncbi:MAG: DNA methyltransferase [Patescibacteria group bacterium]|nr:DNA methyltransferase [Patescibacteria group bacterium]